MFRHLPFHLLLCAAFAPAAAVAQTPPPFTVGNDPACQFATLQAAINAADGARAPEIHIRQGTYDAQVIRIANRRLVIRGGYANCTDDTPGNGTFLSGYNADERNSVITLTGHNDVTLERLAVTGGNDDDNGGGVHFAGRGDLTLRNVTIYGNNGDNGGGIAFEGVGGSAILHIAGDTKIERNAADRNGGGIHVAGNARLAMLEDPVRIANNSAGRFGGGIHVVAPASADIGVAGYTGGVERDGLVVDNVAGYGAGIAVTGGSDTAVVRLFASAAGLPPRIVHNTASRSGGGVYLTPNPFVDSPTPPMLCAHSARIDDNIAANGAGLYADTEDGPFGRFGARVYLGQYARIHGEECTTAPIHDERQCIGEFCTTVDANQATNGSIVVVQTTGELKARDVRIVGNRGANAVRVFRGDGATDAFPVLSSCLIAANDLSGAVVRTDEGQDLTVRHCTIAENDTNGSAALAVDGSLRIERSILWQPLALANPADVAVAEYVLTGDGVAFAGLPTIVREPPAFVAADLHDFRLRAGSPAIDVAPVGTPLTTDMDGRTRSVDLAARPNVDGPVDLGAFERDTEQLIENGDFAFGVTHWNAVTAGSVTADADNGAGGGGSVLASVSPRLPGGRELVALSQCVPLSAPGSYRLSGLAKVGGIAAYRDQPRLHWRYYQSGECDSVSSRRGDLSVATTGGWAAPNPPGYAQIDIGAHEFTSSAALEVFLVVRSNPGNPSVIGSTSARFDGITLERVRD